MGYCKNCGEELQDNKSFCTNCGATIETKVETRDETKAEGTKLVVSKERKPSSSSKSRNGIKILAVSFVVLVGAGFGGYKYIEAENNPKKVAESFISAVKRDDSSQIAALLNDSQKDRVITDGEARAFIKYLKKNPDVWSETSQHLRNTASQLNQGNDVIGNKDDLVDLNKIGKKWALFDQYGVSAKSIYIEATSNENNTVFYVDNKKVETLKQNKKQTFGPYLPGDHTVKGVYKGEYTTVEAEQELSMENVEENHLVADLNVSGTHVAISSNEEEAILYINGKSTGKKIKDVDDLGPVPTDGSMTLQAVLPNGKNMDKSEVVTVEDEADAYLYIEEVDEEDDSALEVSTDEGVSEDSGESEDGPTSEDDSMVEGAADDYLVIENSVKQHYDYITQGNYLAAYELFSSKRQGKIKYNTWSKGFTNTIEDDATIINVNQIDDSRASVTFSMTSYDSQSDGSTLVQTWSGTWYLVKEGYGWKLDEYDIKKQGSRKE